MAISNNKNSTDAPEPNESNEETFSGLWDRDQVNERIVHTVDAYRPLQQEIGATKVKRKGWGIGSFLATFGVFILSQVVIAVPLMGAFINANTDADALNNQLGELLTNPVFIIASAFSMYFIWVAGMWITSYAKGQKSFKLDFKLQFKKWDFLWGLLFGAISLIIVVALSWLLSDVLGLDMEGADNGSFIFAQEGIWFFILAIGFASIVGPFFEELFFRGFALQAVLNTATNEQKMANALNPHSFYSKWTNFWYKMRYVSAVIFSSIVFGFMHFQGSETIGQWLVVIITGLLGMVFAIITIKFKRLGPAVFAHMIYNCSTLMLGVIAGSGV